MIDLWMPERGENRKGAERLCMWLKDCENGGNGRRSRGTDRTGEGAKKGWAVMGHPPHFVILGGLVGALTPETGVKWTGPGRACECVPSRSVLSF